MCLFVFVCVGGGGGGGLAYPGGVQQCRSTTVPKKAGEFQNNLNAFSKEREITDANYQRKSPQF